MRNVVGHVTAICVQDQGSKWRISQLSRDQFDRLQDFIFGVSSDNVEYTGEFIDKVRMLRF